MHDLWRVGRWFVSASLSLAMIIASWPVVAAVEGNEARTHPERYLLRHADELEIPGWVRAQLRRHAYGVPEGREYVAHLMAPGFDARLESLAALLQEIYEALQTGSEFTAQRNALAALLMELEESRDSIDAEFSRLFELWSGPETSETQQRLREQWRSFQKDFRTLDQLVSRAVTLTARPATPAALRSVREARDWVEARLPDRPVRNQGREQLPFEVHVVEEPIEPATTAAGLRERLWGASPATTVDLDAPPTGADLAETVEVKFTQEIQDLAASLDHNPVKIFNWVRNNVDFAAVEGSLQGADHCRATLSCNDWDTASLLVALLRVSGISARYQRGTLDIPEEDAKSWLGGADTLEVAGSVAATGGIPGVIFNNDRLRLERVWVRAFVDMIPSRGVVHVTGDTWVDMDAAFKRHNLVEPVDISATVPFDDTVITDVQNTATVDPVTGSITSMDTTALEIVINQHIIDTTSFFATTMPGFNLPDLEGEVSIVTEESPFLAGTVPFTVVASTDPFTEIPDAMRHKLTFRAEDEFGFTIFSVTRSLPELVGNEISFSYPPATGVDEDALVALLPPAGSPVQDFPTSIPASINVVPEVKVGDQVLATGGSVGIGTAQKFVLVFNDPTTGSRSFPADVTAGEYYAVGIDIEAISGEQLTRVRSGADTLNLAGSDAGLAATLNRDTSLGLVLQSGILGWFFERDARGGRIAAGKRVICQRLPSSGLFFSALAVETLFGSPVSVSNAGATMDIPNDFGYVLARDGDAQTEVGVALLQGQVGSELEAGVPEAVLSTDTEPVTATSTMRILQQANQEGIPIYRIDSTNSGALVPLLMHDGIVINSVNSAIASGREVVIPKTPILFAGTQVAGWIEQDLATGSAAYLISGSLGVFSGGLASLLDCPAIAFLLAAILTGIGIVAGPLVGVLAAIAAIALGVYSYFSAADKIRDSGLPPEDADLMIDMLAWIVLGGGILIAILGIFFGGFLGFVVGALAFAFYSIILTEIIVALARILGSRPSPPGSFGGIDRASALRFAPRLREVWDGAIG